VGKVEAESGPASANGGADVVKLPFWTKLAYGVGSVAYGVKDGGFAYFLCSDVNFGGTTPTTAPPTTAPPTTRPPTTAPPTTAVPTTPASTTRPPTTAPATTGPAGTRACSAAYTQTNQWPGGFQGEVKVTAGSAAITGWTVTMTFPNGQTVTQAWNANVTTSGSTVTARNVNWNGSLAAAGTASFGFLGSWTGSNGAPTLACTAT